MSENQREILETFPNPYPARPYEINISCPEFTCLCPVTSQPDFGTIQIQYVPREKCVELKSLKLYIHSYRQVGTFHERVTNKILEDIVETCKPRQCTVIGDFSVRGGIKTVVTARHEEELRIENWEIQ